MKRRHGSGEVIRITGARQSLADDVRGRQRRYVISMSIRTLSVIAAASLWNVERHVAIVALVLGAVLPYIAVVIANAGRESAPSLPSSFLGVAPQERPMLGPGPSVAQPGDRPGDHRTPGGEEPPGGARRPAA
ncbi:hypothetical protein C6N75_18845 [Streptomyces solincola]|uniref:DUF3099 domain-containing protein n=1 Tax=Streptomyces solincola TaxID=2100817 RepID=A0A2S9PTJ6_9ACTN|nr:DUF3099 domain-containing protein [Streptomyces solincola]PRH77703.1 hypothetical protein C6N75_18845 [Streptomyces solincola]